MNGLLPIVTSQEVVSELLGFLDSVPGIELLTQLSRRVVHRSPVLGGNLMIENVARDRVNKRASPARILLDPLVHQFLFSQQLTMSSVSCPQQVLSDPRRWRPGSSNGTDDGLEKTVVNEPHDDSQHENQYRLKRGVQAFEP